MRARAVHVISVATLLTVAAVLPAAADVIEGTDGPDRLSGTAQRDTIRGYDGRDVLHGRAGDDVLRAGRGHDVLYGGPGADRLFPGRDGWTDDRVYGGRGPDRISALFTDKVWAGGGNDVIRVVESPAPPWLIMVVDCGPGQDTVIWLEGEAFESKGCERVLTP